MDDQAYLAFLLADARIDDLACGEWDETTLDRLSEAWQDSREAFAVDRGISVEELETD